MFFVDELIVLLDLVFVCKVMELLVEFNECDGLSVVVMLYQIGYVWEYCDCIIVLNVGQIVYDGLWDVLMQDKLIEIYGSEYEVVFYGVEEEV